MEKRAANFHEYVMQFPPEVSVRLEQIRDVILSVTPHAEESIRYGMPAFKVGKTHLYMAGYKHHIVMYPLYGVPELEAIVLNYRAPNTKDTIHFKHNDALPLDVIRKIAALKLKGSK
jgi:uncharacterized protein YdhG (YjbR/CyaY superfamily)